SPGKRKSPSKLRSRGVRIKTDGASDVERFATSMSPSVIGPQSVVPRRKRHNGRSRNRLSDEYIPWCRGSALILGHHGLVSEGTVGQCREENTGRGLELRICIKYCNR